MEWLSQTGLRVYRDESNEPIERSWKTLNLQEFDLIPNFQKKKRNDIYYYYQFLKLWPTLYVFFSIISKFFKFNFKKWLSQILYHYQVIFFYEEKMNSLFNLIINKFVIIFNSKNWFIELKKLVIIKYYRLNIKKIVYVLRKINWKKLKDKNCLFN